MDARDAAQVIVILCSANACLATLADAVLPYGGKTKSAPRWRIASAVALVTQSNDEESPIQWKRMP